MRFASLGSGSRGNALLVEAGGTRVLLDCGFSASEAGVRLERLGVSPGGVDAILVTHEHDDHVGGVARFAARHSIPVYLTAGTLAASPSLRRPVLDVRIIDPHTAFAVGDLTIQPYPVPHDAREPSQYVFGDGARRLGVLTDIGAVTPHVEAVLSGCDALVLECNHDPDMLAAGPYPHSLKRRIASRWGHLSNAAAADLLARLDTSRLTRIVAAHLSETNNAPALAAAALATALSCAPADILVATQEGGAGWLGVLRD